MSKLRGFLVAGLALVVTTAAAGSVRGDDDADDDAERAMRRERREIRSVRDKMYRGATTQNKRLLGRYMSKDYLCLHSNGLKQTKRDRFKVWIDDAPNGPSLKSIKFSDSKIRIFGRAAIETCISENTFPDNSSVTCTHTLIYEKTRDGWVVIGEHISTKN